MVFTSWLKGLKGMFGRVRGQRPHRRTVNPRRAFAPRLEALEDRTVPSTLTVSNNHDSGSGSLRAVLASAGEGDTIVFGPSVRDITLTSGQLSIAASITIKGPGANQLSVSGNDVSRVFEIAAAKNVTISGLTVTDGHALDFGGGILNDGSNLTLSGDDLVQNVAFENTTDTNGANGGALDNVGGVLNITDCTIAANKALGGAGASASGIANGGGINVQAGSLTISNSTIQGNVAQAGADSIYAEAYSGAIATYNTVTGLVITNCNISGNRAVGGNVAMDSTAEASASAAGVGIECSATISGATFSGNDCVGGNGGTFAYVGEAEGGAIVDYGVPAGNSGTLTISGSSFDNNQAIGGNDGNSGPGTADPGVDESYGAGIFSFGGTINVSGTTFSGNKSVGGNDATATGTDIVEVGVAEGGAICSEIGATATFSNCTFDNNQAIGGNGNTGSGPVVHVGTGFGAGIFSGFGGVGSFVGSNSLTVNNTTFMQNQAVGGDNNTGTGGVPGLVGVGAGAGIMNALGGTVSVSGSVLDLNQASGGHNNTAGGAGAVFAGLGAGGGIFNYLGNYNSSGYGPLGVSSATVNGCVFDLNQAQGGDGANGVGGGIANVVSATTTVTNSILTLNQATGGGSGAGLGGGAYNDATSSLTLTKALVTLNQAIGATGIGGGIYTIGAFSFDPLTIIFLNKASTHGDNIDT
jgi:fibronectin-binding autotransporter adhesin